jgi:hypothetical protein
MSQTRITQLLWRTAAWILVAILGVPSAAMAQSDEGQLIRIYEMILRPDAVREWSRLQREEAIPALLEGGYPWVDVWRSGGAGDVFYRSILLPLNDLSELDEAVVFERALGEEKAQDLLDRHRELVTSVETTIVRARPDLGFGTPASVPGVGVLNTVTVASGRTEEFEQLLRTSVGEELKSANVASFRVGQVLAGGQQNTYYALLDFHDPKNAALGLPSAPESVFITDGVARLAEREDSPIVSINRVILRYDNTLSAGRRGEAAADQQ